MRKSLTAVALATLACASAAWAADSSVATSAPKADLAVSPVYLDDAAPMTTTPIMWGLEKVGVGKWLEDNNIAITGFVEGGYFYDTSNPRLGSTAKGGDAPTDIAFPGAYSNRGLLNQADLMIQKTIDPKKSWDWGFQVEGGYGTDDALIHSYGILDNRAPATIDNKFNPNPDAGSPQNQFDLVQANVSLSLPIGTGLTIKAGKFVTPFGEETINPTGNAFYTHSYLFTDGIPLTQTGVLATYTFPKLVMGNDLTVFGGVTRGWNESTNDNNGEVDFLGGASTSITDKLSIAANFSEGPESYADGAATADGGTFKGTSANYWTVVEVIPTYKVSDQLTLALDGLYADFPHGSLASAGDAAQWYATALYAGYKVCNYATVNLRGEWYRDQGGFSTGSGISANYYEATLGVQIHPFPTNDFGQYFQLRPEVRYDYSDKPVYNDAHTSAITGAGDYSEFTVAMDAIMSL